MGIEKRGSSYQATVTGRGKRYRRQFPNERDAQVWELKAKAAVLEGLEPEMGEAKAKGEDAAHEAPTGLPRTLMELRDYTHERHWQGTRGEAPARANSLAVVSILGAATPVSRLNVSSLDYVVKRLREAGNSPATINRKLSALGKMMSVAVALRIIDHKPKTERLKEAKGRNFRFTPELEAKALAFWGHIGHPEMQDYAILSVETGLRQGEMLGLRWRDVDDRFVRLDGSVTKSGVERAVPLTPRAKEVLARRAKALGLTPHDAILGFTQDHVRVYWDRMREAVGLEHEPAFVPHIMRHEFCSRLADRNVNAAAIQKLAGHSTIVTTQRYINMSPAALEAAMAAMAGAAA